MRIFGVRTPMITGHTNRAVRLATAVLLITSFLSHAAADSTAGAVLVLPFELNDLTLYPKIEQEQARVAVLQPFLIEELDVRHDRRVVNVPAAAAVEAAKGQGYLFERPEIVARLAREAGAAWAVNGRLHKASHLFVYLKAQLVDATSGAVVSDHVVEIKGWGEKLTRKGVESLGIQLDAALDELNTGG